MTTPKLFGIAVLMISMAAGCGMESTKNAPNNDQTQVSDSQQTETASGQVPTQHAQTETQTSPESPQEPDRPLKVSWSRQVSEAVLITEPPDITHTGGQPLSEVEAVIKIEFLADGETSEMEIDSERKYHLNDGAPIVISDNGESVWGLVVSMFESRSDPDSEGTIKIAFYRTGFNDSREAGSPRDEENRVSEWLELKVRAK